MWIVEGNEQSFVCGFHWNKSTELCNASSDLLNDPRSWNSEETDQLERALKFKTRDAALEFLRNYAQNDFFVREVANGN